MVPEFLLPAHSHFLRKTHTTNPVLRHKQNHTSDGTIGGSRERRFQRLHKIKKNRISQKQKEETPPFAASRQFNLRDTTKIQHKKRAHTPEPEFGDDSARRHSGHFLPRDFRIHAPRSREDLQNCVIAIEVLFGICD